MRSATNEEEVVDLVKLILRSSPQHLVKTVGEIEHSTSVTVVAPIFWSDDHLGDDVVSKIFKAEFLLYLIQTRSR